jgi:hypothetical protein
VADHRRTGRRGGASIPLPRRARPWIQQPLGPPCSLERRQGRIHFVMRPHRELVPGHGVRCRGGSPAHWTARRREYPVAAPGSTMDPAAFGTTAFPRAARGSDPFRDAAASRIGPGSRGQVSWRITGALDGAAAEGGSGCRVEADDGTGAKVSVWLQKRSKLRTGTTVPAACPRAGQPPRASPDTGGCRQRSARTQSPACHRDAAAALPPPEMPTIPGWS